jgi:DNA modification methylase
MSNQSPRRPAARIRASVSPRGLAATPISKKDPQEKVCTPPLPPSGLSLAIEYVPIESLTAYKRRLRKPSPRVQDKLTASVARFGMVLPILVNEKGVVIDGHALFETARALEMSDVPVIHIAHLSDAEQKLLRIALNRLPELNSWDEAALALEFEELLALEVTLDLDLDLAVTGFEPAEIDKMITSLGEGADDGDDLPPEADSGPPVSRLGDVWLMDRHRILCGDATDPAAYQALLRDERATMASHDPPYNVAINGHVSKSGRHGEFVMASGEMSKQEFTGFLKKFLQASTAMVVPGSLIYVFMDWRHTGELLAAGEAAGLALQNLCVWNKGSGAMGSLYRSQHELVFVFKEPNGPHVNNVQLGKFGRNRTNVWDYPGAHGLRAELKLHATPKPVALIADAIRDASNRGDIVLDAFSGSGSTVIAAERTCRRARVMELDPKFVDVTVRRWEACTGKEAVHAETGLSFAAMQRQREAARQAATATPVDVSPEVATSDAVRLAPVRRRTRAS